jgi:hypothetical protein
LVFLAGGSGVVATRIGHRDVCTGRVRGGDADLASSPQPVYVVALAATAYVVAYLIGRPLRRWPGRSRASSSCTPLARCSPRPQLLPAFDVARESVRNQPLTFETAASYSLPPQNLLSSDRALRVRR